MRRSGKLSFVRRVVLVVMVWILAVEFCLLTYPKFAATEVESQDGKNLLSRSFFHQDKAPRGRFVVNEFLLLGPLHAEKFDFYTEDVLVKVTINGHPLISDSLPHASLLQNPGTLVLLNLKQGMNIITEALENRSGSGSLQIYASPWDWICLTQILLYLLASALSVLVFYPSIDRCLSFLVVVGVALRFFYFYSTPYFVRAHDYLGHIDYVKYLLENKTLPGAQQGWETFQPPLYYIVLADVSAIYKSLVNLDGLYCSWQIISLILSLGTFSVLLAVFLKLGLNPRKHCLILGFISNYPALIYQSTQISNDVLLATLSFAAFYLIISFWDQPTPGLWLKISLLLGLVLLTKENSFLLLLISLGTLIAHSQIRFRGKVTYGAILFSVLLLMDGWQEFRKLYQSNHVDFLVGNIAALAPLKIQDIFLKSFYFNPLDLVRFPYVDFHRGSYECFGMFFVKTSLFGEWRFSPEYLWLAQGLMALTLALLAVSIVSALKILFRPRAERTGVFMIGSLGVFLLGHWMFILLYPYVPSMDFRHSMIVLLPFGYLLFRGWETIAAGFGRARAFQSRSMSSNGIIAAPQE